MLHRLRPASQPRQPRLGRRHVRACLRRVSCARRFRSTAAHPSRCRPAGCSNPIDRYSGQRLPSGSAGEHVVYELFREGEAPFEGLLSVIDGGWGMGSDLPLFGRGRGRRRGRGDDPAGGCVGSARGYDRHHLGRWHRAGCPPEPDSARSARADFTDRIPAARSRHLEGPGSIVYLMRNRGARRQDHARRNPGPYRENSQVAGPSGPAHGPRDGAAPGWRNSTRGWRTPTSGTIPSARRN